MVFFVLAFAVSQVLCVCLLSRCSRFRLCPRDCNPRGSSPWTLQARALEWVTRPSSRGSSRPRDRIRVSTPPAWAGGFFTTGAPWEAPSARPQSNPHAEVVCFEMAYSVIPHCILKSQLFFQSLDFWLCWAVTAVHSLSLAVVRGAALLG